MYFEPIICYLSFSITEDDSLGDGQCIIKITQRVKLPFLFLNSNKELFDALEETRQKIKLPQKNDKANQQ
jgi:hypothetical protein